MRKVFHVMLSAFAVVAVASGAFADVVVNEANFPDEVFRWHVSRNFDTNQDGVLTEEEITSVTEINVNSRTDLGGKLHNGISSLKGIEYFTALEVLKCSYNKLTELDLSRNTAIKTLQCNRNSLTELDLTGNPNLVSLNCRENSLTKLNLTGNPNLSSLNCNNNSLAKLDVTYNLKLSSLTCDSNRLTELDLSKNTGLSNLECVDNQIAVLDLSASPNMRYLDCSSNRLTKLTLNKDRSRLGLLNCIGNLLTELDASGMGTDAIGGYPSLNCSSNNLVSLNVTNSELWSLECSRNNLEALDLSGVQGLQNLECGNNQLKALDITSHKIIVLDCAYNQLTSLDLSGQSFTGVSCNNNQLSTLIMNGMSAMYLNCGNNRLTSLDLNSAKGILDLRCENNLLKTLDVSSKTRMDSLNCSGNQITALDVSNNTSLATLFCGNNKLTSLTLGSNTSLKELDCTNNSLTAIDISYCPNLEDFRHDDSAEIIEPKPEFKAHQPDLDGIIVVNFYAYMPEISGVNYNNSYVNFKILNDTSYNPTQEYNPSFTAAGKLGTYYGFRCCVTSVQMADPITATLHYGNGLTVEHTYKLTDYLDKYYYASATPELLRNVVGAMKDYGHYAQIALAEVNGWEIGKDHLETNAANVYTASDIEEARQAVEDYAKSWNVGNSGIKSIGYRLALDADTIIELFIRPNDDYNGNVSAYSRGVIGITDTSANIAVKQSDGRYLVQISGIPAHRLDYTNVIRVVTDKGEFDVKVSALSYVNTILNSEKYNDNMKKAVTSLYKYHKAAKEYWENNNQ